MPPESRIDPELASFPELAPIPIIKPIKQILLAGTSSLYSDSKHLETGTE